MGSADVKCGFRAMMPANFMRHWRQLVSFVCAAAAVVALGWLGDLLEDDSQLIALFNCPSHWGNVVLAALVFVVASTLAFQFGKYLLPLRHLSKPHSPKPHQLLLIPLSPLCDLPGKSETTAAAMREIGTHKTLQEAINALAKSGNRWNGDNFLRAILPHQATLAEVRLIASHNVNAIDNGKACYEEMLRRFCPNTSWSWLTADFEDIDGLYHLLIREIEAAKISGFRNEEIMLDCTGGIKATSIAAALATLHYAEIEVQYVQTNTREVLAYNMQSMPSRGNA